MKQIIYTTQRSIPTLPRAMLKVLLYTAAFAVAGAATATYLTQPPAPQLATPPLFTLPDTCTVTKYDKLGRATNIECDLAATKQDIVRHNQAAIDEAAQQGYADGMADARALVATHVPPTCETIAQDHALPAARSHASALCKTLARSTRNLLTN